MAERDKAPKATEAAEAAMAARPEEPRREVVRATTKRIFKKAIDVAATGRFETRVQRPASRVTDAEWYAALDHVVKEGFHVERRLYDALVSWSYVAHPEEDDD